MGNIPLPALAIQPPQQVQAQDPLQKYAQILQLKNAMAEQPLRQQMLQQQVQQGAAQNQITQQQLADQKAMTASMQNWDGKDYNDLIPLAQKNGASFNAVMGIKAKILEQQQAISTAYKNNAEGTKAQVDATKERGDLLDGALTPLIDPKQISDQQLPQAITSTAQDLVQRGILDPQHGQSAAQLAQVAQQNPDQARQSLDLLRKGNLAQSQIIDEAAKQAQATKDISQGHEADVNAQEKQMEMQNGGTGAMADSRYRNILMNKSLGRPVSADDAAFLGAYQKQKTLVPMATFNLQNAGIGAQGGQPSALAQSVASGQMKWNDVISPRTPMSVKQQFAAEVRAINPNFNSGDFTVEQKEREAFTSGAYSQQLNSINTAREHMKTFTSLADNLNNGDVQGLNKIGNTFGVQFGSDKATNFGIAKQAFMSEVGKAFAGAGVTLADRQEIGNQISAASSPAQLRGAASTADALLAGKQRALQQTYQQGQQGKPNFGNQGTGSSSDPFAQFGGKQH